MTCFQLEVLRELFDRRAAIYFGGTWVHRNEVRENARLAATLYWELVNPARG